MTALLFDWPSAFEAGVSRCGGKGYNVARLARYGFPVPIGGVLSSEVYAELLSAPDLARRVSELDGVGADAAARPPMAARLQELRAAIEAAALPPSVLGELARFLETSGLADQPVAVRSSAVAEDRAGASFAGIHRSFLNVRGLPAIERAILGCFASLWTPQAVSYRRRMGVPEVEAGCAVVICRMVASPGADEPASAGVAFSCDPRTGRRDLIVINAARGLGEKVVAGLIDPDHVQIEYANGEFRLAGRGIQGQPVLSPGQELALARQVWRIHWALGDGDDPQDIEWAHDGERFWILQARPVSRLPLYTFEGAKRLSVIWSTANIKEAVPGVVSILSWSLIREAIDGVLYAGPRASGFVIPPGLQTVRRFEGRAYFDLTAMQWCLYDCMGLMPADMVRAIGGHQPEIPVSAGSPYRGRAGRRRLRRALRLLWHFVMLPGRFRRAAQAHVAEMRGLARLDLPALSGSKLQDVLLRIGHLNHRIIPLVGLANGYPGPFHQALESQLLAIAGARAYGLMSGLLSGGGGITSAEQGYRIRELADVAREDPLGREWLERAGTAGSWGDPPSGTPFRRALEAFLEEFGHRGVCEADVINPRWAENPSYVLEQVRGYLGASPARSPRGAAARVQVEARRDLARLTLWRRPIVLWLASRLRRALALRELGKSTLVSGLRPGRLAALDVGRRLVASGYLDTPDQLFHLAKMDLLMFLSGEWDGRGARELTGDRARQRQEWLSEPPPPDVIIEGGALPAAAPACPIPHSPRKDGWQGIGVAAGRATGPARVVRHPEEGVRLGQGEVLVAPSTDPGWTPLFLRASAIVMEIGGYLSHGATVAREYGIPAVVNIPGILDHVRDGDTLHVDGDAGRVSRAAT